MATQSENESITFLTRAAVNYERFITKLQRISDLEERLGQLSESFSRCEEAITLARATGRELDDYKYEFISREWENCKKLYYEIQSFASNLGVEKRWSHWVELSAELEMTGDNVEEAIVREMRSHIPLLMVTFDRKLIEFQTETSMVFDHLFEYSPHISNEKVE